jgi:hypothetical protein
VPDLSRGRERLYCGSVVWMWLLTGLFFLRVAGQAVQRVLDLPWLPRFEQFQGSNLSYGVLLASQLLLLLLMAWMSLQAAPGRLRRRPSLGAALRIGGWVYFAGSLLRLAVGISWPEAHPWFRAWIPGFFHLVLAAFMLQVACYHLRPATDFPTSPAST